MTGVAVPIASIILGIGILIDGIIPRRTYYILASHRNTRSEASPLLQRGSARLGSARARARARLTRLFRSMDIRLNGEFNFVEYTRIQLPPSSCKLMKLMLMQFR